MQSDGTVATCGVGRGVGGCDGRGCVGCPMPVVAVAGGVALCACCTSVDSQMQGDGTVATCGVGRGVDGCSGRSRVGCPMPVVAVADCVCL